MNQVHKRIQREESASFDRSDHRLHPERGGARPVRDPRARRQAEAAALRRSRVSRRVAVALSARGLPRALRHEDRARDALCQQADRARHPDHHRRHELRRALRQREGSARPCGDRDGHVDHHRRRRHDAGGATVVEDARLPVPAVALRIQSRRRAPRGCDRGRDRAGREARRRRHAARAEDQSAGRGDAHPAGRHRPALGVPSPGLDRPGRPRHQDPGTARAHRLGEADLREDRRDAHVPRREARGPLRGRRRSSSTACRAAPPPPRPSSSSTSAFRRWPPCSRPSRRWKS